MDAIGYEEAKKYLRMHFEECNCFLPNVSCELKIDALKQEASDYYLSNGPNRMVPHG